MPRPGRYILTLGVAGVGLWASTDGRVPEALAGLDHFRVERVELEGERFIEEADVRAALRLGGDASVWDDPADWEARIQAHPLVRRVRIDRRLPSTLVVRLEERVPVALVATPVLEPVDGDGRPLPLDPATHELDLPLIRPPATDGAAPVRGDGRPLRVLAGEAARLGRQEPGFAEGLSELSWIGSEDVAARWGEAGVMIRFRPPLSPERAREALSVLRDAAGRRPGTPVELVDLRWADQVVVRYGRPGSRS